MTTYHITAPHFVAGVIEDAGIILQAAPILGWSVGRQFEDLRSYAERHGWIIKPLIPIREKTQRITYKTSHGTTEYEFFWDEDTIVRITAHSEEGSKDIHWNDLPVGVRKAI